MLNQFGVEICFPVLETCFCISLLAPYSSIVSRIVTFIYFFIDYLMLSKVLDFGWPDTLSPPLERLCNICKSIDSWLNSNPKNVVVIHCKGGLGRMAIVMAAYIDYSNICARYAIKRIRKKRIPVKFMQSDKNILSFHQS